VVFAEPWLPVRKLQRAHHLFDGMTTWSVVACSLSVYRSRELGYRLPVPATQDLSIQIVVPQAVLPGILEETLVCLLQLVLRPNTEGSMCFHHF
jgi:hypothetical protein